MLSKEIEDIAASLGEFAGRVDEKAWERLSIVRSNLRSTAEQVAQLEAHFIPGRDAPDSEDSHDHA